MVEGEMSQIATLIRRPTDGEAPEKMRDEVEKFVEPFRKLRYCF